MTDLIANLRDNFGAPPDTSTIKGIQRYGEMWLSEEESVKSLEFKRACESMMDVLGRAITATEADLEQTGVTHQSLADPVEKSIEAYERLREVLGDLVDAVELSDVERKAKTDLALGQQRHRVGRAVDRDGHRHTSKF